MLTSDDAKDLLQLFGQFVHTEKCSYVQRGAECDCNRFKLYTKVRAIAHPTATEAQAAGESAGE